MPNKTMTPAALNAAIAELREGKPERECTSDDFELQPNEPGYSEEWMCGFHLNNINDPATHFWKPRHDYTGSMDAAIVLLREKQFGTGYSMFSDGVKFCVMDRHDEAVIASEPKGREALAIARAYYRIETGEEIEIVEETKP